MFILAAACTQRYMAPLTNTGKTNFWAITIL